MSNLDPRLRDDLLIAAGLLQGATDDIDNPLAAAAVRVAAERIRQVYDATTDNVIPFPGWSVKA